MEFDHTRVSVFLKLGACFWILNIATCNMGEIRKFLGRGLILSHNVQAKYFIGYFVIILLV